MVVAVAASPTPGSGAAAPFSGRSLNHPSYKDMILSAIKALNDRKGSSRRAISKFIADNYSGLPPTHSALLTHHLRRLRSTGIIRMAKLSYKVVDAPATAPAAEGSKKRGRPPKVAKPGDDGAPPKRLGRPPKLRADAALSTTGNRKSSRPPKPMAPAVSAAVYILPKAELLNSGLFRSLPGATAIVLPRGILSQNAANNSVLILPNGIQPLIAASAGKGKLGRLSEVLLKKKAGRPSKIGKRSPGRPRKDAVVQNHEQVLHEGEHANLIARKPGRPRKIKDMLPPANGKLASSNGESFTVVVDKVREPSMRQLVPEKWKNTGFELKKRSVGRPRKFTYVEGLNPPATFTAS